MKIDKLSYFESSARNKSFTMAAKEHHVAPSAISQQIKLLESSLGFSLFTRFSNKKLELTSAGEVFYEKIKSILYLYEEAIEKARHKSRNENNILTIGVCGTSSIYTLNNAIRKLKEKYSDVEIKLNQINSDDCCFQLLKNGCDILLSCKDLIVKNCVNLSSSTINVKNFGILVNKHSFLSKKDCISFNDLLESKLYIYILDIYEEEFLNHNPNLKNFIKTESNLNLLLASGYLNDGIILTTYEDIMFSNENLIFKKLYDCPINTTQQLYYLNNNSKWVLKEFLSILKL